MTLHLLTRGDNHGSRRGPRRLARSREAVENRNRGSFGEPRNRRSLAVECAASTRRHCGDADSNDAASTAIRTSGAISRLSSSSLIGAL